MSLTSRCTVAKAGTLSSDGFPSDSSSSVWTSGFGHCFPLVAGAFGLALLLDSSSTLKLKLVADKVSALDSRIDCFVDALVSCFDLNCTFRHVSHTLWLFFSPSLSTLVSLLQSWQRMYALPFESYLSKLLEAILKCLLQSLRA